MGRQSINRKMSNLVIAAQSEAAQKNLSERQNYAMEQIRATPALYQKYVAISSQIDDNRTGSIRTHYSIGEVVRELYTKPETYGANAFQYFKEVLGPSVTKDKRFVEIFTPTDLEAIVNMRSEDSLFSLTYEHVRLVLSAKIDTKEGMLGYLRRAVNEKWDSKTMWEIIKKDMQASTLTTAVTETHGRRNKVPETILQLCAQVRKPCNEIATKRDNVWLDADNPAFGLLLDVSRVTEDDLSAVQEAYATVILARDAIEAVAPYLSEAITRFQTKLGTQTEVERNISEGDVVAPVRQVELLDVDSLYDEVTNNTQED